MVKEPMYNKWGKYLLVFGGYLIWLITVILGFLNNLGSGASVGAWDERE
jgi:hypothetical protein